MSGRATSTASWKARPETHDYAAAADYLSLVMPPGMAKLVARRLRTAKLVTHKAKDLLRASGLHALGPDNVHVRGDLRKVRKGERLSPVLLVRGTWRDNAPLLIADGYHRICAAYHLDENADVPGQVADAPATRKG